MYLYHCVNKLDNEEKLEQATTCFHRLILLHSDSSPLQSLTPTISEHCDVEFQSKSPWKYHIFIVLVVTTVKDIIMGLDKDDIIEKMAEGSELLRCLLIY